MPRPIDALYAAVALLTSPIWLIAMIRTGKIRTDWAGRLGRGPRLPDIPGPTILIHAVSVGEVNAIRRLVARLRETRPDARLVVTVTTNTGIARAHDLYDDHADVVRFPFDFSFAVRRLLDRTRPDLIVLTELEVWPNFTRLADARGVPIAVVNGRLTERSARRYRQVRPLISASFRRLAWVGAQSDAIADRFRDLGTPADRIEVTGTMKWDTAEIADEVSGAAALGAAMRIDPDRPLVVAGSTAPGEHELLHQAVPEGVQLLCAPRKPEWFDQAASALPGCVRRSSGGGSAASERFLLDTIGELRPAYALADVVVIGRSFGDLHGSDPTEPAALGKAIIAGPRMGDFEGSVEALEAGDAIRRATVDDLADALRTLLADVTTRGDLGKRAQAVVATQQGATERCLTALLDLLGRRDDGRLDDPRAEKIAAPEDSGAATEEKEER